jgi:acetylornithine deacetylase/succinyl-diaminopimelate desuccinylase-like protein
MICYGLQPFPLDFFQSLTIHGIDERVRLDWYVSGMAMMKRVVTAYASAAPGT